jgi:hypothetical protein
MKFALAVVILALSAALSSAAQTSNVSAPEPSAPSLDSIVLEIQQAVQAADVDLARLRIEKWKAETSEKAQMQQLADSLHKNITHAVPDLVSAVRASHGGVSATFKLYHNINVVFEYLDSLTDAAGSMGRSEEYESLSRDTAALDKARQHLSTYIEQAAASLESEARAAAAASASTAPAATPQATPKKIVVDGDTAPKKPATTKKKKTSASSPTPSPTPN